MYFPKDISIIIPTYNRSEELKITLEKDLPFLKEVKEVLIIDQSTDNKTKKLIASLKNKKIRYFHRQIPSLTGARNFGVQSAAKTSKIIIFFDDDLDITEKYLSGILDIFNNYPKALGVSGFQTNPGRKRVEYLARELFLLENSAKNKVRAFSAYGPTYPSQLDKIINVSWLTGHNMAYKKAIFDEFQFDEKLSRYALGEDFDFSYRVGKKYAGSLFLTPFSLVIHRVSPIERYPTEKISYMNQINHFYINFKNFNNSLEEKIIFMWNLLGLLLLKSANFIITRRKTDYIKLKFFVRSLVFCLQNIKDLKGKNLDKINKTYLVASTQ